MKAKLLLLLVLAAVAVQGCASLSSVRHEYVMRGQVVTSDSNGVYLCVGKHDGATVGQELAVIRITSHVSSNPKVNVTMDRKNVGRVRISALVNDRFGKADVIAGDVQTNDVVELE